MSKELHYLSIAQADRLIGAGDLSPVELTEACLGRIEALNPTLNAFLLVSAEQALAQARAAEARARRGARIGPMDGVPYALKDIYDTAGIRTTAHSRLLAERVPLRDSACAERLRRAGGVLLGKLATHEFATGGPAWDLPWPPARNPWRLDRFPGGSSSGPAAAVAAGLVPVALGSDTGGSIRLPAGFCGLAGIKPSFGRVSRRGVIPLSWTLDNCGPLTWTVEDAAIVLAIIAGHDPEDPASLDRPVPEWRAGLAAGIAGLRLGWVRHLYETDEPASAETVAAMQAAVQVLRDLGAEVVEVELPSLHDYQACYRMIVAAEAFALHGADLRRAPEAYSAVTRYRLLPGLLVDGADHVAGLRYQRHLAQRTRAAMHGLDALITASTAGPAPVQAHMRPYAGFVSAPLSNPFNVAQLPAISICNGYCAEGLPLALQVVGHAEDEAMVLRVAHAYEGATPWRARRPVLLPGEEASQPPWPGDAPVGAPPSAAPAPDAGALRLCATLAEAAGLRLSDADLAGLCEVLPLIQGMRQHVRQGRDYDTVPATVYQP